MTKRHLLSICLLTALAALAVACKRDVTPEAAAAVTAAASPRDQYALVKEIVAARTGKADATAVTRAWAGKRYRWEASFLQVLCPSPKQCNVQPFDYAKFDEPVVQGWLPALEMDAEEHAKLLATCKPHASCVFAFEGTLAQLDLRSGLATALSFSEVRIGSARAARADERWGQRHPKRAPESRGESPRP